MRLPLALVSLFLPTLSLADVAGLPVLDCDGMQSVVALMERGPDAVVQSLVSRPKRFTEGTMPGWLCLTEPFPPERDGRSFLEEINCFKAIEHGVVTEAERGQLGTYFATQIDTFYVCFQGEIITELPTDFDHGETFAEGLLVALDRGMSSHKISAKFGYSRAIVGQPLYVSLDLTYVVPGASDSATEANAGLCDEITELLRLARTDFRRIRGRKDRDMSDEKVTSYSARRNQAGAHSCFVNVEADSVDHQCTWRFDTEDAARQDLQAKLQQLQNCPAIGAEPRERASRVYERAVSFALEGPFTAALSLKTKRRNEVSLRLTHWTD